MRKNINEFEFNKVLRPLNTAHFGDEYFQFQTIIATTI